MGLSVLAANRRRRDRRLRRRGKGEVRRRRLVGVLILGGEDGLEVMNKSGSKLVRGCGLRAIQIDKMGDIFFLFLLIMEWWKKVVLRSPWMAQFFLALWR